MAKRKSAAAVAAVEPLPIGTHAANDEIQGLKLADLVLDDTNARKGHQPDPALLANIAAHGLLMPLLVRFDKAQDKFQVIDGGRRYVTIKHGVETGALALDAIEPISCRSISDEKQALEISMSANLHKAMHPLDTCDAILELAKTEDDEKAIALHFGQTVQWVQQRAKLAQLTDKAKQAYRDGRMDLGTAALMTRLTEKDQDRLCKIKGPISASEVKATLSQKMVDARIAMFDWEKEYPADKIQRSLFDDVVGLLDIALFREHQASAVAAKHKALTDEGYNVIALEADDYKTEQKYVQFTGKVTDENKPSLTWLTKPRYNKLQVDFIGPLISAKEAEKVKAGAKGKKGSTDEAPKPLKATELTHAQQEILRAHVIAQLGEVILAGKASQVLMQWLVVSMAFRTNHSEYVSGGHAATHNGPLMRARKLRETYPDELPPMDQFEHTETMLKGMDFGEFQKVKPTVRDDLYKMAIVAMLQSPWGGTAKSLMKDLPIDPLKIKPGTAFFKRYRQDQLLDYLKRSGVKKSDGGMPIDGKKGTAVTVAVAKAQEKDGWRFGLED